MYRNDMKLLAGLTKVLAANFISIRTSSVWFMSIDTHLYVMAFFVSPVRFVHMWARYI